MAPAGGESVDQREISGQGFAGCGRCVAGDGGDDEGGVALLPDGDARVAGRGGDGAADRGDNRGDLAARFGRGHGVISDQTAFPAVSRVGCQFHWSLIASTSSSPPAALGGFAAPGGCGVVCSGGWRLVSGRRRWVVP